MNFFAFITRLFGIVPQAIDAAEQVANAVKTTRPIRSGDATLWHTFEHDRYLRIEGGQRAYWCSVCQQYTTTGMCSVAVDRRNAGLS